MERDPGSNPGPVLSDPVLAARFETLGILGEGSFGAVLRVRDRRDRRDYALKLVAIQGDGSREARELSAFRRLDHPRVIRCFDGGVSGGSLWLLLELAEGSMAELLDRPGERDRCWDFLRQAASGVSALHAAGLVHRDLKPSNLLVTAEGAKVGDLGLVRGEAMATMTAAGLILGTPGYLAPEQARGERVGPAADLFALGSIAYRIATGRSLVEGSSPGELLARTARGELAPLPGSLPPGLARALAAALDPDPARRPVDAAAWAARLGDLGPEPVAGATALGDGIPGTLVSLASTDRPPPRRPERGPRRPAWILPAVLSVLAAAASLLAWARTQGVEPPHEISWDFRGDVLLVRFEGGDPSRVRFLVEGEEVPTEAGPPGSGARLLARGLPARPLTVRLAWSGGTSLEATVRPEPFALGARPTVVGKGIRFEVRRECVVFPPGREGAGLPVAPGTWVLPMASALPETLILPWEEGSVRFEHRIRLEDLVVATVERVQAEAMRRAPRDAEGSEGEAPVAALAANLGIASSLVEAGRGALPRARALAELGDRIPSLLSSRAPRAERRRLLDLLGRHQRALQVLMTQTPLPVVPIPRGGVGSRFLGLPAWEGGEIFRLDPGSGPGNGPVWRLGMAPSLSFRQGGALPPGTVPVVDFPWPTTGVPRDRPVCLSLDLEVALTVKVQMEAGGKGEEAHIDLWETDSVSPGQVRTVLSDALRDATRRESIFQQPSPEELSPRRWISLVLPGDLWPDPGSRVRLRLDHMFASVLAQKAEIHELRATWKP